MKSIKPGRGPSMMGGVMSVIVGLFGVLWTVMAASMGGGVFALFGVIFIAVAVVQAVYHFKNASGEERYSTFDIVDSDEEGDPLNERFGKKTEREEKPAEGESRFCPYCGAKAEDVFLYCNHCGTKLP